MFTRMVLPRLGGSPSVWSVAMVFFQIMLLAGYAYAHYLMTACRAAIVPVGVHLVLLVAAALTLPLSIASGWGEPPATATRSGCSACLPFRSACRSSRSPPTIRCCRPGSCAPAIRDGHDPYFLYAASNVGSFLALLSYPVLLEPVLSLRAQNLHLDRRLLLLFALIACCGVPAAALAADAAEADARRGRRRRRRWAAIGRWIFLAAVPSGLLVAVTAHISTDVAAAPLLWVLPLSLYLLTWVLVFQSAAADPASLDAVPAAARHRRRGRAAGVQRDAAISCSTLGGHLLASSSSPWPAMASSRGTRPGRAYLTGFYVALSAGGMIGGLFAGPDRAVTSSPGSPNIRSSSCSRASAVPTCDRGRAAVARAHRDVGLGAGADRACCALAPYLLAARGSPGMRDRMRSIVGRHRVR